MPTISMRTRLVLSTLSLVLLTTAAIASDRVAQLSSVSGDVTIERAGEILEARQAGVRVRNGSVQSGDTIKTGTDAAAAVLFADGTRVDMKPETALQITEGPGLALTKASDNKPIGRRIKVLVGEVLSEVVPNAGIATEFETPSGVAAIKGTAITLRVDSAGNVSFVCDRGIALWTLPGQSGFFDAPSGTDIRITQNSDGSFTLENFGTDSIELVIESADGSRQTTQIATGENAIVNATTSAGDTPVVTTPSVQSCGVCGVWTGTRCEYRDSQCPDQQCLVERKCVRGRCEGGRQLTADEDPACGTSADPGGAPTTTAIQCTGCGTAVNGVCVPDNSKCPDLECLVDRVCAGDLACAGGRTLLSSENPNCP